MTEDLAFPCYGVQVHSVVPIAQLGETATALVGTAMRGANDLWGWTDVVLGRELAIVGLSGGTSFVDVSVADRPVVLGYLEGWGDAFFLKDIKVYRDHAYIVADIPNSGIQIVDLRALVDATEDPRESRFGKTHPTTPPTLRETAHSTIISHAHNIALNEETGFLYVLSSEQCGRGAVVLSLEDPLAPAFVACIDQEVVHDAQCVVYRGPDIRFHDREICFNCDERVFSIVDVQDKRNPVVLSRNVYPDLVYVHQGWANEDHSFFVSTDELDEDELGLSLRLFVWDLSSLTSPAMAIVYPSPAIQASDHNVFVKGGKLYLAAYAAGFRLYDTEPLVEWTKSTDKAALVVLPETGFVDTYAPRAPSFDQGALGVFPFFPSGVVAVSDIQQGLVLLSLDAGLPGVSSSPLSSADGKLALHAPEFSEVPVRLSLRGNAPVTVMDPLVSVASSQTAARMLPSDSVMQGVMQGVKPPWPSPRIVSSSIKSVAPVPFPGVPARDTNNVPTQTQTATPARELLLPPAALRWDVLVRPPPQPSTSPTTFKLVPTPRSWVDSTAIAPHVRDRTNDDNVQERQIVQRSDGHGAVHAVGDMRLADTRVEPAQSPMNPDPESAQVKPRKRNGKENIGRGKKGKDVKGTNKKKGKAKQTQGSATKASENQPTPRP